VGGVGNHVHANSCADECVFDRFRPYLRALSDRDAAGVVGAVDRDHRGEPA